MDSLIKCLTIEHVNNHRGNEIKHSSMNYHDSDPTYFTRDPKF